MAVAAVAAIIGAGVSIYKVLHNAHKEKVAKREAERLQHPDFNIPNEVYQNRNISGQIAQQGLPSVAQNYYTSELERGYSTSASNILQAGGDANDIAKLNDTFGRSLSNEAAMDAQMQLKNIEYFQKANSDLADQQTIKYALNEKQPYENKLAEITQRRAAAQENINQGLSDTVGSIAAFGTAISNSNLGKGGSDGGGFSGSIHSGSYRQDPYGGAIAPITTPSSNIDKSFLSERTIAGVPSVNEQNTAFNTGNLSDTDRLKIVKSLLNSNAA